MTVRIAWSVKALLRRYLSEDPGDTRERRMKSSEGRFFFQTKVVEGSFRVFIQEDLTDLLFKRKTGRVPGIYQYLTSILLLIRLHTYLFQLDGRNRLIKKKQDDVKALIQCQMTKIPSCCSLGMKAQQMRDSQGRNAPV